MRSARPFSLMRCCSCLSCHLSCRLHEPRRGVLAACPDSASGCQLYDKGRSSKEPSKGANFEICNDIFTTPASRLRQR